MKRVGILAALLAVVLLLLPSPAPAQVKQMYWATSGMFGPFPITDLIPTVPKEKQREVTIPISMWIIDHPKGLVLVDTGTNVARTTGSRRSATASRPTRSVTTSSTASCRSSATRPTR